MQSRWRLDGVVGAPCTHPGGAGFGLALPSVKKSPPVRAPSGSPCRSGSGCHGSAAARSRRRPRSGRWSAYASRPTSEEHVHRLCARHAVLKRERLHVEGPRCPASAPRDPTDDGGGMPHTVYARRCRRACGPWAGSHDVLGRQQVWLVGCATTLPRCQAREGPV
jgi:hypothetical protein